MKPKRGKPHKRLLEKEGKDANDAIRRQKIESQIVKEPYDTCSHEAVDTKHLFRTVVFRSS